MATRIETTRETALTDLAISGYTKDSAERMLAGAERTGAYVTRGVRITYSERHGYRVARGRTQRTRATRGGRGYAS